jgi:hypothetical protein
LLFAVCCLLFAVCCFCLLFLFAAVVVVIVVVALVRKPTKKLPQIWDYRGVASAQTVAAHDYEILSCDWSKYDDNLIITGSVDKTVRGSIPFGGDIVLFS